MKYNTSSPPIGLFLLPATLLSNRSDTGDRSMLNLFAACEIMSSCDLTFCDPRYLYATAVTIYLYDGTTRYYNMLLLSAAAAAAACCSFSVQIVVTGALL